MKRPAPRQLHPERVRADRMVVNVKPTQVRTAATHRISTTFRRLIGQVPPRPRAMLRASWVKLLGAAPDRPFLAARRRFGRQIATSSTAPLPVLLRLAAFRKPIPASVQTFELLGRPDLRMANVESLGTQRHLLDR